MIKARNVDLTEHSDFGELLNFNNIHIFCKEDFAAFKEHFKKGANSFMTNDEYDTIKTCIEIFGNPYHFNEFDYVFDKESQFKKEIYEHCYRCGKPLRLPWSEHRGLCDECNSDLDEKKTYVSEPIDILSRCPWSKYAMRDAREILSLR